MANKGARGKELSFYFAVILLCAIVLTGTLIVLNLLSRASREKKSQVRAPQDLEAKKAEAYVPKVDKGPGREQNI